MGISVIQAESDVGVNREGEEDEGGIFTPELRKLVHVTNFWPVIGSAFCFVDGNLTHLTDCQVRTCVCKTEE